MAKSIEVKAKTVHDAIIEACEKLGAEQDQVNVEVLSQGGMFGKAKVLVSIKDEFVSATPVAEEPETKSEKTILREEHTSKDPVLPKNPIESTTKEKILSGTTKPSVKEETKSQKKSPITESSASISSPKFTKSLAFVEKLIELLGIKATVTSELTDSAFNININGENMGRLIGKGGTVMSAIQTLVSSVAISNSNGETARVFIDIEGYKEKRGDSLKSLATKKAEYVKKTGRFVKLDPMNARDRAILHTILSEIEGIKTYSTGKDPFRCLCIAPVDK